MGIIGTVGEFLHTINVFLFEKHKRTTAVIGAVMIVLLTILVFRSEADAKSSVIMGREDIILKGVSGNNVMLDLEAVSGFDEFEETVQGSSTIGEGSTDPFSITSGPERVIISIKVDINWRDEDDIRRIRLYENTPDEFTISIIDPEEGVEVDSAKNPKDGEGTLSVSMDLNTPEEVAQFIDKGDFFVGITLTQAGNYDARAGIGLISLTDDSNDYSYKITTTYLAPPVED
ncbi:MAG: hypothetical protein KAH57_05585 [Thermoplasmata archaeon]|nr:hypothetical protein [Thermoplasmata archaeon]